MRLVGCDFLKQQMIAHSRAIEQTQAVMERPSPAGVMKKPFTGSLNYTMAMKPAVRVS